MMENELVFAGCLKCGYQSNDPAVLDVWNGLGDHDGPTWTPECHDQSVWVLDSGVVVVVHGDKAVDVHVDGSVTTN